MIEIASGSIATSVCPVRSNTMDSARSAVDAITICQHHRCDLQGLQAQRRDSLVPGARSSIGVPRRSSRARGQPPSRRLPRRAPCGQRRPWQRRRLRRYIFRPPCACSWNDEVVRCTQPGRRGEVLLPCIAHSSQPTCAKAPRRTLPTTCEGATGRQAGRCRGTEGFARRRARPTNIEHRRATSRSSPVKDVRRHASYLARWKQPWQFKFQLSGNYTISR
jgi:hypothetical protein